MQLIEQYADLIQAEDAAMLLRKHGILTHISSKNSFVMSGYVTGAFKVGLWAVLDSQYPDACAFLNDQGHEITTGLSEAELLRLEASGKENAFNLFNKLLCYLGLAVLSVIGVLVYFVGKSA